MNLRQQVIDTALKMNALGINQGKSGNVSVRSNEGFLITPTGLPYEHTTPEDIVFMRPDGSCEGARLPSSEWRFHRDLYMRRPETNAIVHTHSLHATTLACLGRGIPAFHYMVAVAGGRDIRCAPYATFGTQQLSDHALLALQDRKACLLAQHGMIATGASLENALALAVEVETLAHIYFQALQIGEPAILPDDEMDRVLEKFKTYGQPADSPR
jgi:L-fuculose-phosphate aldolase